MFWVKIISTIKRSIAGSYALFLCFLYLKMLVSNCLHFVSNISDK